MRFNNKNLQSLLNEVQYERDSDSKCMITHLNIDKNNGVFLPCGHGYDSAIFLSFFHITERNLQYSSKCMYCNVSFKNSNYVRQCNGIDSYGVTCTKLTAKPCGFCPIHTTNIERCKSILKNGNRKGNECGNKLKGFKNGIPCCGIHLN